jgi:nitroreductase
MEIEEFLADNPLEKVDDAQELLHQAEDLLNQQDYEALIVKLDEAGEALSGVSTDTETEEPKQGEVKGDSETATSTGQAAPEAATSTEGMNERASTTAEKS